MTVCSLTILLPLSNTGCYKQTPKTNGFRTDFSLRIPIAKAKTVEEALAYLDSLEQTGTLPEPPFGWCYNIDIMSLIAELSHQVLVDTTILDVGYADKS